jgi:branched-chain amino acid transport system permease protein
MDFATFSRLLVAGLMIGAVYALIGLSYSFLYRGTGRINWAQGDFFTLGAFLTWTITKPLALSYWIAPLGVAISLAIVGVIVYSTIVNWISRRGGKLVDVLLATIGLAILLENLISVIWGTHVRSVQSPFPGTMEIGPVLVPKLSLVILGICVITVGILYLFLQRTSFGMAMRATADNRYAASVIGINTKVIDATTWAISAAIAGIAGVALVPLFGAHFYMGVITGLKGFAAAVVGGYGNPWGALVGGLLLGVLETFGAFVFSSPWKDAITFAVLIGFLIIRPHGLFRTEAYDE